MVLPLRDKKWIKVDTKVINGFIHWYVYPEFVIWRWGLVGKSSSVGGLRMSRKDKTCFVLLPISLLPGCCKLSNFVLPP
jgi:hypothetical protein